MSCIVNLEYQDGENAYHTSYRSDLYPEYAMRVTNALEENGWTVRHNPGPGRGYTKFTIPGTCTTVANMFQERHTGRKMSYPRLGAFEVQVEAAGFNFLMHSKLQTRRWPNPDEMARRLRALITRAEAGENLNELLDKMREQQAREGSREPSPRERSPRTTPRPQTRNSQVTPRGGRATSTPRGQGPLPNAGSAGKDPKRPHSASPEISPSNERKKAKARAHPPRPGTSLGKETPVATPREPVATPRDARPVPAEREAAPPARPASRQSPAPEAAAAPVRPGSASRKPAPKPKSPIPEAKAEPKERPPSSSRTATTAAKSPTPVSNRPPQSVASDQITAPTPSAPTPSLRGQTPEPTAVANSPGIAAAGAEARSSRSSTREPGRVTWTEEHDRVLDKMGASGQPITEMGFYRRLTEIGMANAVEDPDELWRDIWHFAGQEVQKGSDVVDFSKIRKSRPSVGESKHIKERASLLGTPGSPDLSPSPDEEPSAFAPTSGHDDESVDHYDDDDAGFEEPSQEFEDAVNVRNDPGAFSGTTKDRELKEMMEEEKRLRQQRWEREGREMEPSQSPPPDRSLATPRSAPQSPDPYDEDFEGDLASPVRSYSGSGSALAPEDMAPEQLDGEPSEAYDGEGFEESEGDLNDFLRDSQSQERSRSSSDRPIARPETSMGAHQDAAPSHDASYSSPGSPREEFEPYDPGELTTADFYGLVDQGIVMNLVFPDAYKTVNLKGESQKQASLMWENKSENPLVVRFLSSSELAGSDDPLIQVRPSSRGPQEVDEKSGKKLLITITRPRLRPGTKSEVGFVYVLGDETVVGALQITVTF